MKFRFGGAIFWKMAQIRFGLTIQGPGFAFGERKELKYFELLLFLAPIHASRRRSSALEHLKRSG
jgi:hypothetical protein